MKKIHAKFSVSLVVAILAANWLLAEANNFIFFSLFRLLASLALFAISAIATVVYFSKIKHDTQSEGEFLQQVQLEDQAKRRMNGEK